jgi:hypothetical protein
MHELCYATSQYPDRDFRFGGTLVSHADIGLNGRQPDRAVAATGNNHGSIARINGKWYVFYHRQTHGHSFSRQGCAEEITLTPDGRFLQAEVTSCGLNGGPLVAKGTYSAMIACHLYKDKMPDTEHVKEQNCPYLTNEGDCRFATNITDGTRVGFKYFAFDGPVQLGVCLRGNARGTLHIRTQSQELGALPVQPCSDWTQIAATISTQGKQALYLDFEGTGAWDLLQISFQ